MNVTHKGFRYEVAAMKSYVDKLPQVSVYYYRRKNSYITYCSWHDTKTVTLASTAYLANSEITVHQWAKDPMNNTSITTEVPCPGMLEKYNKSMWDVDKSDQYFSYHKVLRKNVKYWKTTFFHLIDVAIVNSHILCNWFQLRNSRKTMSENQLLDALVLNITSIYGTETHPQASFARNISSFKTTSWQQTISSKAKE